MKVFNLRCSLGHGFEGWFGSAGDFDAQRVNNVLRCPLCDSAEIERLPSAPRLNLGVRPEAEEAGEAAGEQEAQVLRQKLFRRVVDEVLTYTEDVGDRFPEEARRIHYNEAPDRGIRGTASETERRELEDEGIAVMRIPVSPRLKGSLH